MSKQNVDTQNYIAVIGMSGAFPGAPDIYSFWNNLLENQLSISELDDNTLREAGIPEELLSNPNYVKRTGSLDNALCFDAAFFGYSDGEAEVMDPQQRIFLQHCWNALENAGYIPNQMDTSVGVYAGCSMNRYVLNNLNINTNAFGISDFQKMLGNDKDFLATRVAYKLNLKGPALDIQTACSTSLVAVQMGVLSLLTYQADVALSGGSSVIFPYRGGYLFSDGLIMSKDGHCRPFCDNANGTVFGEGVGVVALKRYDDAIDDNDNILAVIKSAAVNNDGGDKVGYTAPSVNGQADAISLALEIADLQPEDIHYVETHGTGTKMGDPMELAALEKVFSSSHNNTCALGTLKANIGHLDAAAGIASFIKAVLIANSRKLPPNYHDETSKPRYKGTGPFYFLDQPKAIETNSDINIGVSSFGVGGTNAHVIVGSAPITDDPGVDREHREIVPVLYSAASAGALRDTQQSVDNAATLNPEKLADIAFTQLFHRKTYPIRSYSIFIKKNDSPLEYKVFASNKAIEASECNKVAFMFSGQGSQYRQMGKALYMANASFRKYLDNCFSALNSITDTDIKSVLLEENEQDERILNTHLAQLTLFCLEYSLAKTLMEYGVTPKVLIGHSIGEYAAACVASVFSLKDALRIVNHRGAVMSKSQQGAMLAVMHPRDKVEPALFSSLAVSVENSKANTVVSGTAEDIDKYASTLEEKDIPFARLAAKYPFHSEFMEPVLEEFLQIFDKVTFNQPHIELICCTPNPEHTPFVTADYWAEHLRKEVNFKRGLETGVLANGVDLAIEVGPGETLISFLFSTCGPEIPTVSLLPGARRKHNALSHYYKAISELWCYNTSIDLKKTELINGELTDIPGYQFEKTVYVRNEAKTMNTSNNTATPVSYLSVVSQTLEPSTPADQLREIWQRYIQEKEYADNDSFFDLGGHSLNGVQLISELNSLFNKTIEIAEFFENPSLSQLYRLYDIDAAVVANAIEQPSRNEENLPELANLTAVQQARLSSHNSSSRMREHFFCKHILAPIYKDSRKTIKRIIEKLIMKLEGGELYSRTLRNLYTTTHDMHIGDYTAGCFDSGRFKSGTTVGRYSSITPSARFETADHPSTTISSSGIFYQKVLGFSDGNEIPRSKITIGNDVFIGHNVTLVYPCCTIGDGAIIGAGTIVNFDVPPYAVVGGSPATIIRYRFNREKVQELLQSRWWDADLEDYYKIRDEFTKPLAGKRIR